MWPAQKANHTIPVPEGPVRDLVGSQLDCNVCVPALSRYLCPPTLTGCVYPPLSSGEGGLEVRGYGHRPHLPLALRPSLPAGHRGPLLAALAGWHDLAVATALHSAAASA